MPVRLHETAENPPASGDPIHGALEQKPGEPLGERVVTAKADAQRNAAQADEGALLSPLASEVRDWDADDHRRAEKKAEKQLDKQDDLANPTQGDAKESKTDTSAAKPAQQASAKQG